jgi:L-threonylcarbamoyladenylate synthase
VPAARGVPGWLTGNSGRIAVRVPGHALARALCRYCGLLVSTSANRHGQPPARSMLGARLRFGAAVDWYGAGATGGRSGPSRVVELRGGAVLRP